MYSQANCQLVIDAMVETYKSKGFNKPWVGYLACKDNRVKGTGGFVRKPEDGKVEIAYWTFAEFEGRGVASFICDQLIKISKSIDPTVMITAKTAPELNASTRVLQKNGFLFIEIIADEEIGNAWLWALH